MRRKLIDRPDAEEIGCQPRFGKAYLRGLRLAFTEIVMVRLDGKDDIRGSENTEPIRNRLVDYSTENIRSCKSEFPFRICITLCCLHVILFDHCAQELVDGRW